MKSQSRKICSLTLCLATLALSLLVEAPIAQAQDLPEPAALPERPAPTSGGFLLKDWSGVDAALQPMYIKAIMEQAGIHHVSFEQPVAFYQRELNKLLAYSQQHDFKKRLQTPVAQSLAVIAMIHCDWHNGVADPYEFALSFLGREQLDQLKPLYTSAITQLENRCIKEQAAAAPTASSR